MKKWHDWLPAVEWTVGVALTIIAVILQLHWLGHTGALWRDEVGTVQFALMSGPSEIWTNLAYDNFPPLLLGPLRAWIAMFGRSDDALRWFGFSIGILSLTTFWAAARLFKTRAPLLALALVGLSPLAIYTINSIRPYGLGICFVCLLAGCFWWLVNSRSIAVAALTCGVAVLSVHSLYQNVVFLFAVMCAALVVAIRARDYRSMWVLVITAGLPVVSLVVHLPHLLAGREWGVVAQLEVPLSYLFGVAGRALGESGVVALVGLLAAMVLLPGCVFYLWFRKTPVPPKLLFGVISSLVGVSAYMLFVWQSKLPTQPWYYVIVIAFTALCIDAASSYSIVTRWSRVTLAMLVAITSVSSAWTNTQVRRTNIDHIAQIVRTSGSKEDLVIVYPWYCGITWSYYFDGAVDWIAIPPVSDFRIHRYDLLKEEMVRGDQEAVVRPVLEKIQQTLQAGNRVWVVGTLPIAPQGTTVPVLPPAPHGDVGWLGGAYEEVWGMQVTQFLVTHSLRADKVAVESNQPVSSFENLPLIVIDGWRE